MRLKGVIGIDIGSESVKAVALEMVPGEKSARVVGVGAALTKGVKKGAVTEPEEAAKGLKETMVDLEK